MPTHVALLRGINVGGSGRLPMARLRALAEELGHHEVATYIASGNLVFTPARAADPEAIAADLEAAIEAAAGFRPATVVRTAAQLAAVRERNPFPEVADPKKLHVGFHRAALSADYAAAVEGAAATAAERGSRDRVAVDGSVVYLATPDGLGRSVLAPLLDRIRADDSRGTFRNWATVTALLDRLDLPPR